MSADNAEETVMDLAKAYGLELAPAHLLETVAAWRLMAPHLERVRAAALTPHLEPASLFRP